jgi:hypothetical protein
VRAIRELGHHRIVVKEAIGLAGHNAIRLWEPELLDAQRQWMKRKLESGRELMIEPWLERVVDFSVQLERSAGGVEICGYTGLINDQRGQFQGNWAAPNWRHRMPVQVAEALKEPADISARIQALYETILVMLEKELRAVGYGGPLGIDAFVYRDCAGQCRLKPIVEINPRYTMGRLTLELMKHVAPGSHGLFRLVGKPMLGKGGFASFTDYAVAERNASPLVLEGEPTPRIRAGTICLNDPEQAQACLAIFEVNRDLRRLSQGMRR